MPKSQKAEGTYPQLINRVRITLLTECFATSAIGLTIFIVFLFDDLIHAIAKDIIRTSGLVTVGLLCTGATQIIFNERWLRPIIGFFTRGEGGSPAGAESRTRLPWLLFRLVAVICILMAAFFVIFWGYSLTVGLKLITVCLGMGALLSLVVYILTSSRDSAPVSSPRPEEALRAGLIFPLKSAGLSLFLWTAFAVYIGWTARVFLRWDINICVYMALGAASSGVMAFCIQYLFFKATLNRHILPVLLRQIPAGMNMRMPMTIRRKMLFSFIAIIIFLLTFTGVLTHYRVTELFRAQMAQRQTVLAGGPEKVPAEPDQDPIRRFLAHFLIIATIAFSVSILASILLANDLSRPVKGLLQVVDRMRRGRLEQEIPIISEDEIGVLVSAFQELALNLNVIGREAHQIAEGDLTRRVEAEGDLADSFNLMVDNLGVLVKRIKEASFQVSTSASEILGSARELESGSSEQAASINETMTTIEELSSTSRQIAGSAEAVARVADETLRAAEEGRKTLSESRQGMEEIQTHTQSIADRIFKLNGKSKEIGVIVDLIDNVASKTHLLALNAALEGSRAGEAGRGFSLVAEEMRRLAVSVVESTKEIKRIIREIQEAADLAVQTTEAGLQTTDLGREMMRRTEGSLERILGRIRETTEAAKQISFATQQQRSGMEQVVLALDEVSKVSKESIAGNKHATQSASDLAQLSEELRGLVGKFKVSG